MAVQLSTGDVSSGVKHFNDMSPESSSFLERHYKAHISVTSGFQKIRANRRRRSIVINFKAIIDSINIANVVDSFNFKIFEKFFTRIIFIDSKKNFNSLLLSNI